MRRLPLLCLLLAFPATAARAGGDDLELLRLKRLAMEAQFRIAETYARKGDLSAARRAYEAVVALQEGGRFGGSPAVERALAWLAAHQDVSRDGTGFWDCDGFMKHDRGPEKCDGAGGALYDVGVSSLALLAFLGAGYTDRRGKYPRVVRRGLNYLLAAQDDQGAFGTRATHAFMYNSTAATMALCEATRLTGNPRYKAAAQKGLKFILKARNPYLGWRYQPRGGENDTSVTAWCIAALEAGDAAGLGTDADAYKGARAWIEKMTDPKFGRAGYNSPGGSCARPEGLQDRFPPERSQAMTAAAIYVRIATGEDPARSEVIAKGAKLCVGLAPTWDPASGAIDMYFWYYGTLAMARVGGQEARRWNAALERALLPSQHRKGARAGSWNPAGPWGRDGGRVYATALMALALEASGRARARLARR